MPQFWTARRAGLAVLALVIAVLPFFLPNNFYFNMAILIGLNGIVCVGLNLLIGYSGQISLGHAAFFGLGAYASAIFSAKLGWHPLVAMMVGALAVSLLAFLVARPILKLRGHYLAMATLGLGIIISIVLNRELDITGGPDGMTVSRIRFGDFRIRGEQTWYWIIGVALWVAVWLSLNLIESPIGRMLRAVHGSEVAASTLGIDVAKAKSFVFVLSAAYASIAGSLTAHYLEFVTPSEAGFLRSVEFVTMVVLGGMASTFGAVVGAAILTALPQALAAFHEYEHLVFGAILMATMILMPKGLVPTLAEKFLRRRS